ncbi:hypothetical protein VTO42DRAFT_6787 [Malbranchea cinnamomea]
MLEMKAPQGSSLIFRMSEPKNKRPTSDRSGIDLSKIENHLIHEELHEICQSMPDEKMLSRDHNVTEKELLSCLAKLLNNYFNPIVPVLPTHIAPTGGGVGVIDALLQSICDEGDGVLISGPSWIDFDPECWSFKSIETIVVELPNFADNFTTKLITALSEAADRSKCRIKALLINNPHAPFGQCYPQEVLEACLKFCQQRRIHYISDETYALTEFPSAEIENPVSFLSALSLDTRALRCDQSRIHTVWSIGENFGTDESQMGCIITQGDDYLIAELTKTCKSHMKASSVAFATTLLSSQGLPFLITMNSARLAESYIRVTSFFLQHGIEYIPASAGLSIFARLAPRAKTWEDEALMVAKLKDAGVLVHAGRDCRGMRKEKGWVRLTFSLQEDRLNEALRRMEVALGFR